MKAKIIIVLTSAAVLAAGFILWRHARVVSHKRPPPKKYIAEPRAVPKASRALVAIVMDDFGYNMNNIDGLFSIKEPITLSILPNLRYSRAIADIAESKGYEVILHLPLEPHRKDVKEELDTINSRMDEKEVAVRLESAIEGVPGLKGVSNHMGSRSTEERPLMTTILNDLKRRRLYFLDSLTSKKSVCAELARRIGLRYAKRNIFLDNSNDPDYIRRQMSELKRFALKRGRAIAICHDRKNTVKALSETMPKLSDEGIDFVYLSELVE